MSMKLAQSNPDDTSDEAVKAPPAFLLHKPKRELIAYPDYARSLVSQRWQDPAATGGKFAVGSGAMGAALGMLLARLAKNDPKLVAAGGLAGGVGGALLGNAAGRASANSENSRTFWLRRKPGINDPGEYESSLRYAGRPADSIAPRVKKADIKRDILKGLIRQLGDKGARKAIGVGKELTGAADAVATGGAGYLLGHEGISRASGFSDSEQGKNVGGTMGAILALAARGKYSPRFKSTVAGRVAGDARLQGIATVGELVPVGAKALSEVSSAMHDTAGAQRESAAASKVLGESQGALVDAQKQVAKGNLGQVLKDTLSSPAALGTYAGLGVAGLGGLATGLSRAKTDEEIQKGTSRGRMVAKDFLRYAIPLGIGGGVLGSMKSPAKPSPAL